MPAAFSVGKVTRAVSHRRRDSSRGRGTRQGEDSLATEIARVRADKDFTARAKKLLERDKELIDRLAR